MILTHLAMFSFFDGMGQSGTPPAPVVQAVQLGGRGKRDDSLIYRVLRKWDEIEAAQRVDVAERVYEALTEPEIAEPVRKQAAKIVRPYVETKAKIPPPSAVDWDALEHNIKKLRALIDLWERVRGEEIARLEAQAILDDDEEIIALELY